MKRLVAAIGVSAVLLPISFQSLASGAASPAEPMLTYTIKQARAYAYKFSVSKEMIEAYTTATGVLGQVKPCDPKKDPYKCKGGAYNRERNCPDSIALGRTGSWPRREKVQSDAAQSGGAGDATGRPPQQTPIYFNQIFASGQIGRLGSVREGGGVASDAYVNLLGFMNREAHTESNSFSDPHFEERCYRGTPAKEVPQGDYDDGYLHLVSRSGGSPTTFHLAECSGDQCDLTGLASTRIGAGRARTIVWLRERDGVVRGRLSATFEDLSGANDDWSVDLLATSVSFRSDGTRRGLRWSATTRAAGVKLMDRSLELAPGRSVHRSGFRLGIAKPFVKASRDGRTLTIVVPGLVLVTERQTVFFGGAEVLAGMGRATERVFEPPPPTREGPPPAPAAAPLDDADPVASDPPTAAIPDPIAPVAEQVGTQPVAAAERSVEKFVTGTWLVSALLGSGFLVALLVILHWARGRPNAAALYRTPPLRLLDWLYRAFLKT